jgi:hypothetical protein
MNYDAQTIEKAKSLISFGLRQADVGDGFPKRIPMSPSVSELIDEPTAQQLYDEIITEWEKVSGFKIERYDS